MKQRLLDIQFSQRQSETSFGAPDFWKEQISVRKKVKM